MGLIPLLNGSIKYKGLVVVPDYRTYVVFAGGGSRLHSNHVNLLPCRHSGLFLLKLKQFLMLLLPRHRGRDRCASAIRVILISIEQGLDGWSEQF